jgi:polyphosphate:AMP phosphotransferase
MFESAELGHAIDKARYKREEPVLRADLLDAQYDVGAKAQFPVLVLVNGVDGAGKGDTVNVLNAWMDPRHIRTRAFGEPTLEERTRPLMWRFWQALPPAGKIGMFFIGWYGHPIYGRLERRLAKAELDSELEEILRFEEMLANEGALVLKLWFHLSKRAQKKRLTALERDPATRFRVTEQDWKNYRRYDRLRGIAEHVLRNTDTSYAPWSVVEGADRRYRNLTVGRILLAAMRQRLGSEKRGRRAAVSVAAPPPARPSDGKDVLGVLDLSLCLSDEKYERELPEEQGRLAGLTRRRAFHQHSLVVVFEGNDAAGKGGAVRRLTGALDARQYNIVPVSAPTEEERAQPYLWRFWRQVPRLGCVTIFDRSWYGRVLVERVEGFCSEADWMRAYSEINQFEGQLVQSGAVLVKLWLAISEDEQLKRFHLREKTRFKRFKITDEDWRNRKKWAAYAGAVCDMVDRTSTEIAPWTLVEANDKRFARVKVIRTVVDRLAAALGR